ncbi:membrane protein insertase YidC [Pararhizobium haloflavum]|uniref:membrane protein insertase YidC n=1 Tax=Pararhizobium haloflavum TaxID=2037914 RepID=UPI0018E41D7D|nr:membrane protein insertase YidC [Pararhizobium haloflavum]
MDNNRNYFVAIALSVLVLVVWQFFYINPRVEDERRANEVQQERVSRDPSPGTEGQPAPEANLPEGAQQETAAPTTVSREAAVDASDRVQIDTPSLSGSINLSGARFDDLSLKDYRETVDDDSPIITLLSPAAIDTGYFVEFGFIGNEASGTVPGPDTVWQAPEGATLTDDQPVTLTYENEAGLVFTRTISVDDDFMFQVDDAVENTGEDAVSLSSYGRSTRFSKPTTPSIFVLHEGMLGYFGEDGLQEVDYGDIEEDGRIDVATVPAGWMGITDKYWATALIPDQGNPFTSRFAYFDDGRARYQTDFRSEPITIGAGETGEVSNLMFAGAKQVPIIDGYEEQFQIPSFDLMIDWGWFYFITKPLFYVLDFFYRVLGNFGVSILITTVIIKLIFFPLANKSYVSMANMKKVQPKMEEIKKKHGDDRMAMQQAMMELYKKEKINPIAGCWPVLLQIPVFFALYKVIYVTIEMRHAPFFGWIQDLSAPDPTSIFNLFGLLPYDVPGFLLIGVWPLIMGVTMFMQMRMNPTPPDPTQQMIFNWMPVVFTFMLATFPAGLVIYWAWNNTLSIIQQGFIMKRQGAKIELWDNLKGLFRKKPKPAE